MPKIKNELIKQGDRTTRNEENIELVFTALKQLLTPTYPPREPIGFSVRK